MSISDLHEPVLLERCIEVLAPALEGGNAILVDCTLGLGGHTEAFLNRFPNLHVVGQRELIRRPSFVLPRGL